MNGKKRIIAGVVLVAALLLVTVFFIFRDWKSRSAAHPVPQSRATATAPKPTKKPNSKDYSIVPGGAKDLAEAKRIMTGSQFFKGIRMDKLKQEILDHDVHAYVAYRVGDHVFWTHKMVTIKAGEMVFSDGNMHIRAHCLNFYSFVQTQPILPGFDEKNLELPVEAPPNVTYNPGPEPIEVTQLSPLPAPPEENPTTTPPPIIPPPGLPLPSQSGGNHGPIIIVPPIIIPGGNGPRSPLTPPVVTPPPVITPPVVVTPDPVYTGLIVTAFLAMVIVKAKRKRSKNTQ